MQFLLPFGQIFVFLSGIHLISVSGIWKSTKVVGGRLARKGEIPYIVALMMDTKLKCGGAIYNERFIITAAHCVRCVKVGNLTVVANALDLKKPDGTETRVPVRKVIVHPQYTKKPTSTNDIAVIELSRPFVFTKGVSPSPIPILPQGLESKGKALLAGYGGTQLRKIDSSPAASSYSLQIVDLVIVPRPECDAAYANALKTDLYDSPMNLESWGGAKEPPKSAMCARARASEVGQNFAGGGAGSCQGDSGGPLLCQRKEGTSEKVKKYLCGIVSGGVGCGLPIPDVFTEVSQFTNWIEKVTETK